MKIAITGASGHIGNNLCRMLLEKGHQVKVLIHRSIVDLTGLPLEHVRGDVTNVPDLVNLCSDCDVVFHLAGHISIRKTDPVCERINVESCINLIKAARSTGIRKIIHFSSIHAFQANPLNAELDETRELALNSRISYDRSKAMGQKIMLEAASLQTEIIVLNPTAILGPNDFKPSLQGNALIRFYKGWNPVMIPGGYNWVDVRDVCMAAINAIEFGISGSAYLLGARWQSLETLTREIHELGGKKPPVIKAPFWAAQLGAPLINLQSVITGKTPLYTAVSLHTLKNSHKNISSAKAGAELRFNPRPFGETLSDTITWFRDNNYI